MYLLQHRRRRSLRRARPAAGPVPAGPPWYRAMQGAPLGDAPAGPAWYRAMQGTTLGQDESTEPTVSDAQFTRQWQQQMIDQQTRLVDIGQRWVKREELQRWLQIAATLSIPLAAAAWRAIFRAGRRRATSTA